MVTKIITAHGTATQNTNVISPFGSGQSVGYLNGASNYLKGTGLDSINYGIGNWTVEGYIYPTTVNTGDRHYFYGACTSGGANGGINLVIWGGYIKAYIAKPGPAALANISGTTLMTANKWYHVAAVRNGTNITLYLDGSVAATATVSASDAVLNNSSYPVSIGRCGDYTGFAYYGYMSEFRISLVARYTTAFTPPAFRFMADSNTELLLHMNGSGNTFVDSSMDIFALIRSGFEWL